MSNLTTEQVTELTESINARLAEFGKIAPYMPDLSCGVVRIAFDVIEEWMARTDYLGQDEGEENDWSYNAVGNPDYWRDAGSESQTLRLDIVNANGSHVPPAAIPVTDEPEGDPPPLNHAVPDLGAAGKAAKAAIEAVGERMVSRATAPQKSVEKSISPDPRVPDPDVAREKLAQALAAGSNGSMAAVISKPRTLEEADADAAARAKELGAVVAALQAMAVDGEMPTVARWETERVADLPSWKTLSLRHGLSWVDVARKAGLRYTRQGSVEPEVKAAQIQAAERKDARLVSYEMLCAEIRRIAMGNAMPTQAQFDAAKPALWPTANAVVVRLGTSWADLADILGLDLQRGRRSKA